MKLCFNWDETHLVFNKDNLVVGKYLMDENTWKAFVSMCEIDYDGEPPKVASKLKKNGAHGCFDSLKLDVTLNGKTFELEFDYWPCENQFAITFNDFVFGLDLEFIEKDSGWGDIDEDDEEDDNDDDN